MTWFSLIYSMANRQCQLWAGILVVNPALKLKTAHAHRRYLYARECCRRKTSRQCCSNAGRPSSMVPYTGPASVWRLVVSCANPVLHPDLTHSVLLCSYPAGWPLPFTPEFGVRFPVSAVWKKQKMFLPHPRVKVSIVGSLRDREVACSASDRQGSNFESCVWRTVSSQSSHHPQEVLLAQCSLYVHKGGLKPDSFHFIQLAAAAIHSRLISLSLSGEVVK